MADPKRNHDNNAKNRSAIQKEINYFVQNSDLHYSILVIKYRYKEMGFQGSLSPVVLAGWPNPCLLLLYLFLHCLKKPYNPEVIQFLSERRHRILQKARLIKDVRYQEFTEVTLD